MSSTGGGQCRDPMGVAQGASGAHRRAVGRPCVVGLRASAVGSGGVGGGRQAAVVLRPSRRRQGVKPTLYRDRRAADRRGSGDRCWARCHPHDPGTGSAQTSGRQRVSLPVLGSAARCSGVFVPGGAQGVLGPVASLAKIPEPGVLAADFVSRSDEFGVFAVRGEMRDRAQRECRPVRIEIVQAFADRKPAFDIPQRQNQLARVSELPVPGWRRIQARTSW
jgi:hypothetical protein